MSTSRDFGLQLALTVTKSELLHFGYWDEGDSVTYRSIPSAQQKYADKVLSLIPEGTKTILDIGCGTGEVALQLKKRGFEVELVSPDLLLNEKILEKHPDRNTLHCCKFEDFKSDKTYDLLLEMESCQYVRLDRGFQRFREVLSPGGAILISDTFRTNRKRDYKDWHVLDDFYEAVKKYGFEVEYSLDITRQTAPTSELASRMYDEYMVPIARSILASVQTSIEKKRLRRSLWGILRWVFKKGLGKMRRDFYEKVPRLLDRDNYTENVKYMIFVLRKKPESN